MVWKVILLMSYLILLVSAGGERHKRRGDGGGRRRGAEETLIYGSSELCPYPCSCPVAGKKCNDCEECPRQLGEPCSEDHPCDIQRSLVCRYLHGDAEGVCRESIGVPCIVYNTTYEHGQTFNLDCRTQCTCQNGTYGCSSLCPQEHISPSGNCRHPRLVDIPGQCCREWMCDSQNEVPVTCQPKFTSWTPCNSDCGSGLSTRQSNINARCVPHTETRVCQIRRCQDPPLILKHKKQHHLRRGHECKATHRLTAAVHFRFGPCRSRKKYRPKFCGSCPIPDVTCKSSLSTTVKVDFLCEGTPQTEDISSMLPEYLEPEQDLWTDDPPIENMQSLTKMTALVQWVLKCSCEKDVAAQPATSSTGEVILHRVHRTAEP